ncbi:hypothetical protein CEUSTIGMA_g1254.t1 [Chlamydomonas eustigma]|uniref:Uncharacterized protein n=1 Tax=Chlamydomonas eustigma TaxID=1157962 RepID=A0A250WSK5_9CHLO|nr:hypothetical protein CEUSTIGMA_g1254.t1 [Chlamydomonas eustigma]|eukprot:GAX73803.1 hypothetical protein CEUSTIGMA_g1254.t1 [Chlamydomonas eustigma]
MTTAAEERAKHSVVYSESTSEIKDDVAQLISCLKSNQGALGRQPAAFLIWHHAFEGDEKLAELVGSNIINVCFNIIDSPETSPVDKSCCAGILTAVCESPNHRDLVIKGRSSSGSNAPTILHSHLEDGIDIMRSYATRILRLVAEDPAGRTAFLKITEQRLMYIKQYSNFLMSCRDGTSAAHICALVKALIHQRDDLKGEAIQGGLVESLIQVVRYHKAEHTTCMAMGCLMELAWDRESWPRIVKCDGLRMLVDVLGPPPSAVMKHEMARWKHLIDPVFALQLQKEAEEERRKAEREREEVKKHALLEASGAASGPGSSSHTSPVGPEGTPPSTPPKTDSLHTVKSARFSRSTQVGNHAAIVTPMDRPSLEHSSQDASINNGGPDPDPSTLLSINSVGLKWHSTVTMPTYAAAAGCLYEMCSDSRHMHEVSMRLGASRLVPLLAFCMDADGDGKKKKKGKKKGLTLTSEQTEALISITGCLKFLTMVATNRYRVAQLGAAKYLKPIYEECGHTLLRRNAQAVLSNIAMLAENGQVLLEGKLPEEFLVAVPMRLSQDEQVQLSLEFPDAPFLSKLQQPAANKKKGAAAPKAPPKAT